ncbi:MAG TPA: class I SAM-dependent methyltransferase [Chloroflexota bacterium]|nr:class I SAM-dependent methyltransferase [Chloroflexota bacterium]
MEPTEYGDQWAEIYDQVFPGGPDADAVADVLGGLAGPGPALELAIGTGRLALPLAGRGVEVHGIDISEAMVEKLRAKPGGADIPVTMADMRDFSLETRYPLIYLGFNTLFALPDQEDQIRVFQNVARHLAPEGVFVVEGFVPDLRRFDHTGSRVGAIAVDDDEVRLEVSRHDLARQTVTSQHVIIGEEGARLLPVRIRYVWPSEMDLMARLAELRLRQRWGGWNREPFTSASQRQVSIYELAPD